VISWLGTGVHVTTGQVDTDLKAVLARRLPKALITVRTESNVWLVYFPNRPVFGVSVTFFSRRNRIYFQHGGMDWSVWALSVVRSELGVLYEGECGDEGVEGTWMPDPRRWPTYESFIRTTHRRTIERGGDAFVRTLLAEVPQTLRS
jgi:hypothetical protein